MILKLYQRIVQSEALNCTSFSGLLCLDEKKEICVVSFCLELLIKIEIKRKPHSLVILTHWVRRYWHYRNDSIERPGAFPIETEPFFFFVVFCFFNSSPPYIIIIAQRYVSYYKFLYLYFFFEKLPDVQKNNFYSSVFVKRSNNRNRNSNKCTVYVQLTWRNFLKSISRRQRSFVWRNYAVTWT